MEREREMDLLGKEKTLNDKGDIFLCCVKFCEGKRLLKKKEK